MELIRCLYSNHLPGALRGMIRLFWHRRNKDNIKHMKHVIIKIAPEVLSKISLDLIHETYIDIGNNFSRSISEVFRLRIYRNSEKNVSYMLL